MPHQLALTVRTAMLDVRPPGDSTLMHCCSFGWVCLAHPDEPWPHGDCQIATACRNPTCTYGAQTLARDANAPSAANDAIPGSSEEREAQQVGGLGDVRVLRRRETTRGSI